MSEVARLNPSRLSLARKRRGLTLVALAERVDLTAQSLSNAENGRLVLSSSTLERVAEVLRFPVNFFTAEDIEHVRPDQVSFRARSKMTARARDAVLSAATLAVALRELLEHHFRLPGMEIPTIGRRMPPDVAAEYVRARWGLGEGGSNFNMVHLLESKGVAVFSIPPEYSDIDAFSFWRRGRAYVILNTMKTSERSRFDAAHELGHLVMHWELACDGGSPELEKEANSFASAFLMPRASVLSKFRVAPTTEEIIRNKRAWNVAALALAYRLRDLGILSEWTYRQAVIELGRQGFRSSEPHGIPRETSQLLNKALAALRANGTTFAKIGDSLDLDQSDLNDLVFGLSLAPVKGEAPRRLTSAASAARRRTVRYRAHN